MLTPGSDFAGYRIERTLGRGGMGDVYLARHPRLPRSDALKLMSEELSRSEVYRQRFSAEADIACMVQHESVVRVYDRGEDDDRLWIAMEYVEGTDLARVLLTETRVPAERAVALVERVAAGLDAIHALGLLHRDVKPANILVTKDVLGAERALLTDFGIAKSAADSLGLTGVGDLVATLHYAAPEQFELRSGELDRRVDVYALGCVLYEMLTGRVPLEGDSVATFWQTIQVQFPPAPSALAGGIPPSLDAVVMKALSKRRDDRFASAGELARAARSALSDAPSAAPAKALRAVSQPTVSVAAPAPVQGPFRLTVRQSDLRVAGGLRTDGPVDTSRVAAEDAGRLTWLVGASNFFALPASLPGGAVQSASLTVESPDRFHSVAWAGQAPPALAELVREVERLAHPGATEQPEAKKKSRRPWLIGAGVGVVAAAAAVTAVLLLTRGDKAPDVPGGVSVVAGRGTVTVDWTASNGKVDHYVIYRDGKPVAPTVHATTYTDTVGDTQAHQYAVQAVDSKGKSSPLSLVKVATAEVRPLNPAETALLAQLPPSLVDAASCKPIVAGVEPNLSLALTCAPKSGQTVTAPAKVPEQVQVFAAPTAARLKSALTLEISSHGAKGGSCAAVPEHGTWNYTETPKVINGQIICYRTTKSSLIWSYDSKLFYVKISTSSSYQSLLTYWEDASLHLP